jgi:deoxycytidylate deaminase
MSPQMHPLVSIRETKDTKHTRYLNILSKLATDIANPVGGNARLAACIVYRNDIVSFGINEMKSHPFQAKYGKNKDSVYLHAETSAIKNALRYISTDDLEKSTLYICRVKYSDQKKNQLVFGLSKPCSGCFRCINAFNIRNVVYSLDKNGYAHL